MSTFSSTSRQPIPTKPATTTCFRGWCVLLFALAAACFSTREASAQTPAPSSVATTPAAIPAARYAERVAIITIDSAIDAHVRASFERRLREAVDSGAQAIVVELNTPGGEVSAVLGITNAIKTCPVANTIAWVHPNAYSGGSLIALSCREMILADNATVGDSLLIAVSFGSLNLLPEQERQKLTAPLLAEVVNNARLRGYDEKLVQGMVSLGVELWLVESIDKPGTFLFIGRDEYRAIFDTEPVSGTPTSSGAAPLPADIKQRVDEKAKEIIKEQGNDKPGAMPRRMRNTDAGQLPRDPDASPFIPAVPDLQSAAVKSADNKMVAKSTRPLITQADKGKWKLLEYVSDGRGVLTLKNDTLFRYRLAQPASTTNGTINNDEELKAFLGAKSLARLDMNWAEHTAAFLDNPFIKGTLLVIFLIAAFIEFTHPGVVLPGVIAAVALILLAAPMFFAGLAYWWALVAVIAGVGLIGLEIFVLPGFGVFGVVGLIALFGGLIGLVIPASSTGLFPDAGGSSQLLSAVATMAVSTITAIIGIYFIAKNFGNLPILNRLILQTPGAEVDPMLAAMAPAIDSLVSLGQTGTAQTPLRPSGRARFGDDLIDVVAEGPFISAGDQVRVAKIEGLRIVVERA